MGVFRQVTGNGTVSAAGGPTDPAPTIAGSYSDRAGAATMPRPSATCDRPGVVVEHRHRCGPRSHVGDGAGGATGVPSDPAWQESPVTGPAPGQLRLVPSSPHQVP